MGERIDFEALKRRWNAVWHWLWLQEGWSGEEIKEVDAQIAQAVGKADVEALRGYLAWMDEKEVEMAAARRRCDEAVRRVRRDVALARQRAARVDVG